MAKINPYEVHQVLAACDSRAEDAVVVDGVMRAYSLDPAALAAIAVPFLEAAIANLPIQFRSDLGEAGSTLDEARLDVDGEVWGDEGEVETLLCLAIAVNRAGFVDGDRTAWEESYAMLPPVWFSVTEV